MNDSIELYAVHVRTESSDHYNWLIEADSFRQLQQDIEDKMDSEFWQISEIWITSKRGEERFMQSAISQYVIDNGYDE